MAWVPITDLNGPEGLGITNLRVVGDNLVVDRTRDGEVIETDVVVGNTRGPRGLTGVTPNLTLSVTGLAAGASPTVAKTGTPENPSITLGIPKGDKGDTGSAPNLTATVSTLAEGSPATVSVSGTNPNYILNLGIPKGDKGDAGNASASIVDTTIATPTSWSSDLAAKEARLSGSNLIPNGALEHGNAKWWPATLVYDTADKPAGQSASVRCTAGAGTQASTGTSWFYVDPSSQYDLEFWVKADKPNSVLFIEIRDQDGAQALPVTSGAIGNGYIANNLPVPTTWTKYSATISFTSATRLARIGAIFFNHANGTERNAVQSIAGLRIRPSVATKAHVHSANDITSGIFAAARLPSATPAAAGVLQLATLAETTPGVVTTKGVTPSVLMGAYDAWQRAGTSRPLMVVIGSSNAPSGAGYWPALVGSALGATVKNFAQGGGAFTSGGTTQFLAQLTAARDDASFANADVGLVFIADASNDIRAQVDVNASATTGASKVLENARTWFPNARVVVLPVIWPSDPETHVKDVPGGYVAGWVYWLRKTTAMLDALCRLWGCEYVQDSWSWLTGHDEWMVPTEVHANASGHAQIAAWLLRHLRGQSTTRITEWAEVTPRAGFSTADGVLQALAVQAIGSKATLQGTIGSSGTTAADTDWGDLPVGFAPAFAVTPTAQRSTGEAAHLILWPSRAIRVRQQKTGSSEIWITVSYDLH